ncbi:MAG: sulfur carrier protein ThiS [Arsenophonus sp.]|nr:MAG: sulfur carrier protein ThiS [Arsenophonus sp.]
MNIIINNKTKVIQESVITIEQLLKKYEINTLGIALAINKSIIPRESWDKHLIHNNDNILLFKIIVGG